MPTLPRIETLLRDRTRFVALHHVSACASTQDWAATAAHDATGKFVEAVFWADHQTRGRGRQLRHWHDEPGLDLAITFRIRQALPAPAALPAVVPCAVAAAVEPLAGAPLRFKWPNDVFLHGRKLCGVLIDAGVLGADTYLIGIGINCNRIRFPPELEASATSLALATGTEVDRGELLLALAVELDRALAQLAAGATELLAESFRNRLGLVGRRVKVTATEELHGTLTQLDLQRLELDGRRSLPLASIRAIAAG